MLNFNVRKSNSRRAGERFGFIIALFMFSSLLMFILTKLKIVIIPLEMYFYIEGAILIIGTIYLLAKKEKR